MNTILVLLHNDCLYQSKAQRNQTVLFGSGKKDNVFVRGFKPSHISVKINFDSFSVNAKKQYGFEQKNVPFDSLITLDRESHTYLFVTNAASKSASIKLPFNCSMSVGRDRDNDICLNYPFVSSKHLILKNESGILRVEDCGSSNGTYVNGKKIKIARMDSGDILSIMSVNIVLINGSLRFENAGDKITIKPIKGDKAFDNKTHATAQINRLVYRRSPRTRERQPDEDIILAGAPSKAPKYEKGRGVFSSLAGSSAMLAGSLAMGFASPALLAARAASLVAPVASATSNKSSSKKRKKNAEKYEEMRREKYGAYIESQKARIEAVASVQREILMRENPNVNECAQITVGLRRNLWERTPYDSDYLDLRLGMGYESLCVSVKARQDSSTFQMEDDEVKELTDRIIEETRLVDNVPVRVSFLKNASVGIVGQRQKEISLVKNLLVSLCTLHCYEDVKIIGFFDKQEKEIWESIRWFPHIWDDEKQSRFLAFEPNGVHEICEMISEIINSRQSKSDYNYSKPNLQLPHYVVIFGSKEVAEKEPVMRQLLDVDASAGITSVFVFDDLYSLPYQCKYIIDVDNQPSAYERSETNNKFFFTPDEPLSDTSFDMFARRMSAIELDGFSKRIGLPDSLTLLNGYDVSRVEELNVVKRWSDSQPYNTLAAPIGVMRGGKTFCFDIHEKAYGPHGLVAGTTGSGKSELLQTWILSMALNYHPHDVTFVLIDYKGGGMASLLEPLPHVVGKITNIGANINRSLISLQSEIKRRQRLFDEAGVNHIDKYQRLYKSGMASQPLPHLIIVADEFAELKKEEPDFMSGLISASRVGRSLGIHLVLATQKPGGIVDDQIQSNSRFRLCLKVQDVTDSREMIKRPDAARLTHPGRAYIRVGEDEYFDLFQSYYSGAPYVVNENADSDAANDFTVSFVETNGARNQMIPKVNSKKQTDCDELQAVVKYIVTSAHKQNIEKLQGPWLPELPDCISLNDIDPNVVLSWPQLPIGLYDDPKAQSQGVQILDFYTNGHHAIYGTSGTGKTTLLKTILLGIGKYYKPDELSAYVIDAGGWSLSAFSSMPNIGGIALDGEEEKIEKLQCLILEEIEYRKKVFLKNAVSSLKAYREDVSKDLPAIIVVVDNIVPLFELYPDIEYFFVTIARDGATYGIYLLYTANSTSGVRYKIVQNVKGAVAFELTDKGDYPTIVGRPEAGLPKIRGRAYFKDNPPIVFQAALPFVYSSDREANEKIQNECSLLASEWKGIRPKPIPVMPEILTEEMLLNVPADRWMVPAGIAYDTIEPVAFDLSERYSLLVTGSMHTGKSKTLIRIIKYLLKNDPDTKVIAFDSKSKSLLPAKDLVDSYVGVDDDENVSGVLNGLVDLLNNRKKAQNAAKKNTTDFNEKQFALNFEQTAIVIDNLKEFVDSVSDTNRNTMERICRMAGGLGIIVICAGRISDISHYNEIESLTRVIVSNQNGLAIGGTPAQYPYFRNNLKYSEKEIEAGDGNAYTFVNSVCKKVKIPQ